MGTVYPVHIQQKGVEDMKKMNAVFILLSVALLGTLAAGCSKEADGKSGAEGASSTGNAASYHIGIMTGTGS